MAEYIDKDAAMLAAMDYEGIGNAQDASMDIASAIGDIPAADVRENVKGEWKVHGYSAPCSNCGFDTGFGNTPLEMLIKQFKFCHNCGARMLDVPDTDVGKMGGAEDGE